MKTSKQINLHTWSRSGCKVPTLPPNSPTSPSVLTRSDPAHSVHSCTRRQGCWQPSSVWVTPLEIFKDTWGQNQLFFTRSRSVSSKPPCFLNPTEQKHQIHPDKLQHGHTFSCNCITLYWWMWYFYFYKLYMYLHHSYCYVCSYNHNQVDPVLSVEQQSAVRWPPTRNEPLNWPQACDELMHDTMHVIYCTIRDRTNDYYH